MTTTFFAFAGKCGGRGAYGRAGSMTGAWRREQAVEPEQTRQRDGAERGGAVRTGNCRRSSKCAAGDGEMFGVVIHGRKRNSLLLKSARQSVARPCSRTTGSASREFVGAGIATEGELVGAADLLRDVVAGLRLHAGGEGVGLLEGEAAVEEIQCLDRRGGFAAAGGALAGVGTIEGAEHGLAFAADLVRVDHAAQAVAA